MTSLSSHWFQWKIHASIQCYTFLIVPLVIHTVAPLLNHFIEDDDVTEG